MNHDFQVLLGNQDGICRNQASRPVTTKGQESDEFIALMHHCQICINLRCENIDLDVVKVRNGREVHYKVEETIHDEAITWTITSLHFHEENRLQKRI